MFVQQDIAGGNWVDDSNALSTNSICIIGEGTHTDQPSCEFFIHRLSRIYPLPSGSNLISEGVNIMKILKILLMASAAFLMQPAMAKMCPDGSYVAGNTCKLCPNGKYVGGKKCDLNPDGSYTAGKGKLTPNGSYVPGNKRRLCPDGSYVAGNRCKLMPNGTYIGVD